MNSSPLISVPSFTLSIESEDAIQEELPPTSGDFAGWSSHPFFQAHVEFDPAIRRFCNSVQDMNKVLSRVAKAVRIIDLDPELFDSKHIRELAGYLCSVKGYEYEVPVSARNDVPVMAGLRNNRLVFSSGRELEIGTDVRNGTTGVPEIFEDFCTGLTTFRRQRVRARDGGVRETVNPRSNPSLAQRVNDWRNERPLAKPVSRGSAHKAFTGVQPGHTDRLLSQTVRSFPLAKQKASDFLLTEFVSHPLSISDQFDKKADGLWSRQASKQGAMLSMPGASDLNEVIEVHLVHALPVHRGAIRLPPSGEVVLIMDEAAYKSCCADLSRLAQEQPRIRVFVPWETEGTPISEHVHMAEVAAALLEQARVTKRLHHVNGAVEKIQPGTVLEPSVNRVHLVKRAGIGAGEHCAVWHFPDPKKGAEAVQKALRAFRFLPSDFTGAEGFWYSCLVRAGMAVDGDMKDRQWTADSSLWTGKPAPGENGKEPDVFENTYGQNERLNRILDNITHAHPGSDEEKAWACDVFCRFFDAKKTNYENQLKKTEEKMGTLSRPETHEERMSELRQMVTESSIRQALYDQMNEFVTSDDRILFVTAPCGVGKTLSLLLLSGERKGRAAWFSFPMNQLATEFKNASPSKLISIHCQGDVKGADLKKFKRSATPLNTAVFVHPTLLSAIRGDLTPSAFDGLTLFVDEWHGLSDEQLQPLQELLARTKAKLVLLSATPRDSQSNFFKDLHPEQHRVHEISVDAAEAEGLLRPRLVFDGTGAFFVEPKTGQKSSFEARFERAQATLEARIQSLPLWQHSGLIYVDRTKEAAQVCQALRESGRYPGLTIYNATGQTPEVPDFTRKPFMVVCCRRYREGANVRGLNYVLALGSLNDTAAIQISGRLSRKFPDDGGLPYGLLFAFGDGSENKSTLRSDRGASTPWAFLDDCRTLDGKELIDELPMLPPVRPEVFEVGALKGNRFRIPFNALPGNVDEVEAGSLLGRKRQASSSILSSQVARSRVSSRFSS